MADEDRFWEKVDQSAPNGCWLWTASRRAGYGHFTIRAKPVLAHRFAYELLVGPIGEGLELDHLCRNPPCVNPAHLEPVTHRENTLRGDTITSRNARKTHCIRGHPFSGDNLYIDAATSKRRCQACQKERDRLRYLSKKAALDVMRGEQ